MSNNRFEIAQLSLQSAPNELADALNRAYGNSGFAYLADHGVEQSTIDDMFDTSRDFHALPHAQKMQIEVNRWHRGFIPINTSTNRTSSVATTRKPNQSESLMIMHEQSADPQAYLAGPNQWPAQLPQLQTAARRYVAELSRVGLQLIEAIEIALSQQAGALARHFASPTTFLRLLRYPTQAPEEGLFGSAPHTDYGFLTLLAQDGTGGLQVKTPDGDWLDVPARRGCFVLNVGDMLARFTNGEWLSTPHRVINRSGRERFSVAFFFDPNVDTVVSPLIGANSRYAPVRYGDYLRERLEKNHAQHARQNQQAQQ